MCFKPVHLSFSNRTIFEAYLGYSFQFTPVTLTVESNQARENVDLVPRRDRLDVSNLAEYPEFHDREDTSGPGERDGPTSASGRAARRYGVGSGASGARVTT